MIGIEEHDEPIKLFVAVPVTCLKPSRAREYLETLTCPSPATVYGLLLSLVGEEDRQVHMGTEIAIGIIGKPEISTVLRTVWRIKSKDSDPGLSDNKRPDFQELLTGLELVIWLRPGSDGGNPTLHQRVRNAFAEPASISRFGGLSLGESTHLVDIIRPWRDGDPEAERILKHDPDGDLSLPVWVDHVGSGKTVFDQYRLVEAGELSGSADYWSTIWSKKER